MRLDNLKLATSAEYLIVALFHRPPDCIRYIQGLQTCELWGNA